MSRLAKLLSLSILLPFLLLPPNALAIDYFDQSMGGRQRPSGGGGIDQRQQQQPPPQSPFGQPIQPPPNSANNIGQSPLGGGNQFVGQPSQFGRQNGQFGQVGGQQQQQGGGGQPNMPNLPFGQQQRQNGQMEHFGRGLQQQRNSSITSIGGGPNSNSEHSPNGNVLVEIQLRSYANPSFRLPGNHLCMCPQGNEDCIRTSPQHDGWKCLTSLSVFVLSADAEMHFNETGYQQLSPYGQYPFEQQQSLQQPSSSSSHFQFQLDSQPNAIAVLVHNLGARISMDGRHLVDTNAVTIVDYFVHNLTTTGGGSPFGGGAGGYGGGMGGQHQGANLQGKLQGTELTLSYSISCRGGRDPDGKLLVGPGCDLSCNSSSLTGNTAICVSQKTGYYSLCRWTSGGNTQVTNCQNCPWGIKEDAYCADAQGGVLLPDHAGVVSNFYYKAFIGLAVLCALLLLCFLLFCLISLKSTLKSRRATSGGGATNRAPASGRRRGDNHDDATAAGFGASSSRVLRGEPEAAALNKPPPPYTFQQRSNGTATAANEAGGGGIHASVATGAIGGGPLAPLPRSNASTASVAGSEYGGSNGHGGIGRGAERRFPPIFPPMLVSNKSSGKTLSPPRYQPLPHLGITGGGATDSMNNSFAGLPPPSVSADV